MKARVKDGRFEPEEPMGLPDGTVVHLTVDVEEELSEEDRRALEASLRRGIEDVKAGRVHSSEEVHVLLKARVHSPS